MTVALRGHKDESHSTASVKDPSKAYGNYWGINNRGGTPGASELYLWIPQEKTKALEARTKKGLCRIWDSDWKVMGQWENGPEFKLATIPHNSTDFEFQIAADGNITLRAL